MLGVHLRQRASCSGEWGEFMNILILPGAVLEICFAAIATCRCLRAWLPSSQPSSPCVILAQCFRIQRWLRWVGCCQHWSPVHVTDCCYLCWRRSPCLSVAQLCQAGTRLVSSELADAECHALKTSGHLHSHKVNIYRPHLYTCQGDVAALFLPALTHHVLSNAPLCAVLLQCLCAW
jgi:hypothetical protein